MINEEVKRRLANKLIENELRDLLPVAQPPVQNQQIDWHQVELHLVGIKDVSDRINQAVMNKDAEHLFVELGDLEDDISDIIHYVRGKMV